MAREKTAVELRDIVQRLKHGHGIKRIRRETGAHRTVIRKLRDIAVHQGWLVLGTLPSEKEVYDAYHAGDNPQGTGRHFLEAYRDELKRYVEEGYTYVVMHELMKDRVSYSESTIRRYVQSHIKNEKASLSKVMREREFSVMEVDFGSIGIVYDEIEKRNRKAYIFSGRLRFSTKAYRAVVFDQTQETFFECHIRTFDYFGGVPERVVPDNLKAAVVKASFTDPVVNRGYRELAEHYGFLIDPTKPYHPEHKGGVENDIKYVKRNFLPIFREKEKQKGRNIPYARECERYLREWEKSTADARIIKGVGSSPDELFEIERAHLKELPADRFDIPVWKKCAVNRSGRVNFDRSTYSVPDRFMGKSVMTAGNTRKIRVFYDHKLIAEHPRSKAPYRDVFNPDHLSDRALRYMEWTKDNLLARASAIGPSAKNIIQLFLEDKIVSRERSARGILSLADKYGISRLENACTRALLYDAPRYDAVKRILANGFDNLNEQDPVDSHGQRIFAFARTAGDFYK